MAARPTSVHSPASPSPVSGPLYVEIRIGTDADGALRSILSLAITETAALQAKLPGEVARGTNVEMDHLHHRLAHKRVASRLVLRAKGTDGSDGEP